MNCFTPPQFIVIGRFILDAQTSVNRPCNREV